MSDVSTASLDAAAEAEMAILKMKGLCLESEDASLFKVGFAAGMAHAVRLLKDNYASPAMRVVGERK